MTHSLLSVKTWRGHHRHQVCNIVVLIIQGSNFVVIINVFEVFNIVIYVCKASLLLPTFFTNQ